jgi:hypothetical protein
MVQYYWGGGYLNEPRLSLRESATEIQIAVALPDLTKDPHTHAILLFAASGRLEVRLASPIDGRRIVGPHRAFTSGERGSAAYRTVPDGDSMLWAVPRVLDLAPDDAVWVLRAQGFEPTVLGSGRRVRAQDPAPGEVPTDQEGTYHGAVAITAGD